MVVEKVGHLAGFLERSVTVSQFAGGLASEPINHWPVVYLCLTVESQVNRDSRPSRSL